MNDRKIPRNEKGEILEGEERRDEWVNTPLPTADDPGGARAKGYSADPETVEEANRKRG